MQALEVPEILRVLGDFLDYPRLAAATAVCKSWNTTFTPFLYRKLEWGYGFPRRPRAFVVEDNVDHIRIIKIRRLPWIPSLTDCTNLEEAHLDLTFVQDEDKDDNINTTWIPLTTLVRQNPKLVTVCVSKPGNEFLRAVFTCCPHLKRLEIDNANLKAYMMTDIFFNVCLRLEELKMADTTLDLKAYGVSWENWPTFSRIKKLWLGITHEMHWDACQLQQQHEFIQQCPNLESLTWSFSRGPLPFHEIKELLSPKKSPCPKIKAFEFHYPGFHPILSEDKLAKILGGCKQNLTSFGSRQVLFGEVSGEALIKGLASTLTRLRIDNGGPNTGPVLMKILSSCPNLVYVECSTTLDVGDILGVQSVKSAMTGPPGISKKKMAQLVPLPKSIHLPEWACKNLETLRIDIGGLRDKEPEWQRAVLKQLAKLKQLRVLGRGTVSHSGVGSRDGLDLRLEAGLEILSSLTKLERLRYGPLWQEMSERDIKWMVKAWPRFSYLFGWVHHSLDRRIELKKLLNRHGVTVEACYAIGPEFSDSEESDEESGGSYLDEDEDDEDRDEEEDGEEDEEEDEEEDIDEDEDEDDDD